MLFSNASSANITMNGNHDYGRFLKFGIERTLNITVDTTKFNPCYKTAFDTLVSVIGANATGSLNISFPAAISAVLAKISSSACVSNIPSNLNNSQFSGILRETIGTLAWGDSAVSDVFRTSSSSTANYMREEPDVFFGAGCLLQTTQSPSHATVCHAMDACLSRKCHDFVAMLQP